MAIEEFDMSKVEVVFSSNEVELDGVVEEAGELVKRLRIIVPQKIS